MQITRIGLKNRKCFEKLLLQTGEPEEENIIRLGVLEEDTACGAAAFRIYGDHAELMNIYVAPAFRRRGMAQCMLDAFEKMAEKARLTCIVAFYHSENEEVTAFLSKNGFLLTNSMPICYFRTGDAEKTERLQQYIKPDHAGHPITLRELPPIFCRALEKFVRQGNYRMTGPILEQYNGDMSFVMLDDEQTPTACMLCTDTGEQITIEVLVCKEDSRADIPRLLGALYEKVMKAGRADAKICSCLHERFPDALRGLFGDCIHLLGNTVSGIKVYS